ncbi:hypothetical protein ABE957_08750 [Halomonas sp. CS7]|uniref:Uncharacterized protein n=1 Tax=Halomonas pelophila TaxID=3151122 RepID=A0ABV1N7N6_9GAMM
MGMEDREYYWEDRKRRENKFDKSDTYSRPKELRRTGVGKPGQVHPDVNKQQWKLLLSFFSGGFFTFWFVMIVLNLNANILFWPFEMTKKVLVMMGLYSN